MYYGWGGSSNQEAHSGYWTKTYSDVSSGQVFVILAQKDDGSTASLSVSIYVDGSWVKGSTATSAYGVASSSIVI